MGLYSRITNTYYGAVSIDKRFLVDISSYDEGRRTFDDMLKSIDFQEISNLQ